MKEKHTILIVDDSPVIVQSLAEVLKEDYKLKVATSGARALEILENKEKIDLILLDVVMPEMDGYEVLQKIKDNPKTEDIPVIFVTGNDSVSQEEKGLKAGVVDYITKPIRTAIVKARVKIHITLKTQRDTLQSHAICDMLTGLYNRNHLDSEGGRKFAKAFRQQDNLTILMVDIDHFKAVNDTYGHLIGDKVLKAVANILKQSNRVEDFVARFGGEEFIVLLEDCDKDNAINKAEQFRKNIEELHPEGIKITASFGVVNLSSRHKSLEDMIKDADTALYEAKESGRNKVVCST